KTALTSCYLAPAMKRTKRLTKRERKAIDPGPKPQANNEHIHCVACGRHLDAQEFSSIPASATYVTCEHGSRFPSCTSCLMETEKRVAQHDRTGQAINTTPAWH
ncbi:MAG TPA: hypothetical protein VK524_20020, partial [Polyangiaceae bacterium]|nr:hypothetical protein [Polyangiaceae bacterium]